MKHKHPSIVATKSRTVLGAKLVESVNDRVKTSRELLMQSRELLDTLSTRKQK
ncbi:MAG: hypothetical protein ACO378_00200 [Sedimenticolaceae bacterium]